MCVCVCVLQEITAAALVACLSAVLLAFFLRARVQTSNGGAHTLTHLGCFDRSRTDVWGFFALDEIEIEGWSEKETGGLSRNTVLLFLLRDARETSLCCNPPLPTHRKSTQSGTVHFVLVSPGWTVPFDSMRCKEGRGG